MGWLTNPEMWIALVTLLALEIVLGIDNIVFISILSGKLPPPERSKARNIGLSLAMFTRVALLLSLSWLARLTAPLFSVIGQEVSGRDIILITGGLFLMAKSTHEIHQKLEGEEDHTAPRLRARFTWVIVQILVLDLVFSLDSVITAVGMANELFVMITAVVLAVVFMLFFSGAISGFVEKHPTIKMLALSFLILIGVTLILEGLHQHVPKGYIYFAMAYSVGVEMLNLRLRRKQTAAVKLRQQYADDTTTTGS